MKIAIVLVALVAAVAAYPQPEVEGIKEKAACIAQTGKETLNKISDLGKNVVDALKEHAQNMKELESLKELLDRVDKFKEELAELIAERKFGQVITKFTTEIAAFSRILGDVVQAVSESTNEKLREIAADAKQKSIELGIESVGKLVECLSL